MHVGDQIRRQLQEIDICLRQTLERLQITAKMTQQNRAAQLAQLQQHRPQRFGMVQQRAGFEADDHPFAAQRAGGQRVDQLAQRARIEQAFPRQRQDDIQRFMGDARRMTAEKAVEQGAIEPLAQRFIRQAGTERLNIDFMSLTVGKARLQQMEVSRLRRMRRADRPGLPAHRLLN